MLGRSVLIVVLPVLLLQAVVALVLLQRHYDRVTRQLTDVFTIELGTIAAAVAGSGTPAEAHRRIDEISELLGAGSVFRLMPGRQVEPGVEKRFYDLTGGIAAEVLDAAFAAPVRVVLSADSGVTEIQLGTPHGALFATVSRRRLVADNPYLVLTWSTGAGVLLVVISLLFLINQIRPIRELAEAAEAFGVGQDVALRPRGAREVRQAFLSFMDMRRRIQRHIEQRTLIPMALSHDLGTPITRMRLALETEVDIEEIRSSLDEMEGVVRDFLEFARAEWRGDGEVSDAHELVRLVAAGIRDREVEIDLGLPPGRTEVRMRPGAMRRCLGNLTENAAHYGLKIRISVARMEGNVMFAVEDDGPGIPEARRQEATDPFRQFEGGRSSRKLSGMGLGLAIARDVARLHGGELWLGESADLGGLRATVTIPADSPPEA